MEQPVKTIHNLVLSTISRTKNMGVTNSDYLWLLEIAISFYQERLRGFEMPSVVSEEIEVNLANRVWAIPADFIAISRVAYSEKGRLWDLTADNTINLLDSPGVCDTPVYTQEDQSGFFLPGYWYASYTRYGEGGGKNINYYRIDHENRRIVFSESIPPGRGVVEYLSSGKNVNEHTYIPLPYVDAFRNYLVWQVHEYSDSPMLYQRAKDRERQFRESMWDSNILAKAPTLRELLDELYKGSGLNLR